MKKLIKIIFAFLLILTIPSCTKKEEKFLLKNINENFEIKLKYNYYQNDFKTNKFVDCFIEIKNKDMKKVRQLYEG